MRVLTSSVLVMEAIVLGLAIPVALVAAGQPAGVGWLLGGLALVCLLLPAFVRRPWFVGAGWALQVVILLTGFFEPMLFALGATFAALWWAALHLSGKVEAAQHEARGQG
jgi:hypothetical protein